MLTPAESLFGLAGLAIFARIAAHLLSIGGPIFTKAPPDRDWSLHRRDPLVQPTQSWGDSGRRPSGAEVLGDAALSPDSIRTHTWLIDEHTEDLKAAACAPLYRGPKGARPGPMRVGDSR